MKGTTEKIPWFAVEIAFVVLVLLALWYIQQMQQDAVKPEIVTSGLIIFARGRK